MSPLRANAQGYLEEGDPLDEDEILSADPMAGVSAPAPHTPTGAAPERNHARDFFGEFISGSPFNPMNMWDAIKSPEAIGHTVEGLVNEFKPNREMEKSGQGHLKNIITGGDPQGRLAAFQKLISESVGEIPIIGKPILRAAGQLGDGEYGKGAAGILNVASNYIAPEVGEAVPAAIRSSAGPVGRGTAAVGRGLETAGEAMRTPSLPVAAITALSHPLIGAAEFAAPYASKVGGKGLQSLGRALEGLNPVDGGLVQKGSQQFARGGSAAGAPKATAPAGNFSSLPDEVQQVMREPTIAKGADQFSPSAVSSYDAPVNPPARGFDPVRSFDEPVHEWLSGPDQFSAGYDPDLVGSRKGYDPVNSFEEPPDTPPSLRGLVAEQLESPQEALARRSPLDQAAREANTRVAEAEQPPMSLETIDPVIDEPPVSVEPEVTAAAPTREALAAELAEKLGLTEGAPAPVSAAAPVEAPPSLAALDAPAGEPGYAEWAQGIDDIVNSAEPGDMPRQHGTGIAASQPTKAIQKWMAQRRADAIADGSIATEVGAGPATMPESWQALINKPEAAAATPAAPKPRRSYKNKPGKK